MNKTPQDLNSTADHHDDYLKNMSDERFELTQLLGRGGMASVFAAYDNKLQSTVALKILHSQMTEGHIIERLRREVVLTRTISNAHVLKLFDLVSIHDKIAVSMEFIEGGTLREFVDRYGPLAFEHGLAVFLQAARGLDAAHRLGTLHRDLKPHNILMVRDDFIKVADFGLAFSLTDSGPAITIEGNVGGTPAYMAPEVISGDFYDPRSDIYALGITAFEFFTGRAPFVGSTVYQIFQGHLQQPPPPPSSIILKLPKGIDEVILRCLMKNPDDRFQSTGELILALEALDAGGEVPHRDALQLTAAHTGLVIASQSTPQIRKENRSEESISRGYNCAACGEPVPPQFVKCPFCKITPLKSLGAGEWSVVLNQSQKMSFLKRMKHDFSGIEDALYPAETLQKIIQLLRKSGLTPLTDEQELIQKLGLCPAVILDEVDEKDANEFLNNLELVGGNGSITKYSRPLSSLLASSRFQTVSRLISVSAAFVLSAGTVLSFISFFQELKWPIATVIGMAVYAIFRNLPKSSLKGVLKQKFARGKTLLSPKTRELAVQILPQLEDPGIRRIAVSLMSRVADIEPFLTDEDRTDPDAWIETGLNLAFMTQRARSQRLLQKTSHITATDDSFATFDPSAHQGTAKEAPPAQEEPILSNEETRALTRLLQLRARIDMLVTRYELAQAQQNIDPSEISDIVTNLNADMEAFTEIQSIDKP